MILSPADVLRHWLVEQGFGTLPTSNQSWPLFVASLPISIVAAACVYNTTGILDGRLMRSGTVIEHPGIQI
jgi:hypothetical protein